MAEATAGKDTRVVALAGGTGTGTGGELNKSDVHGASAGDIVDGSNSLSAPMGYNALDATSFEDEAENFILGMKTGEWSLEGNYSDQSTGGLFVLEDAHDTGSKVEIGFIVDDTVATSADAKGYEMTVLVTNFDMESSQDGKVTYSATLQCADGDGWNKLA